MKNFTSFPSALSLTKDIVGLHFLQGILKTVVANYALDKLKIEIAGNSHPALASPILWDKLGPKFSAFSPKQAVYVRIKSPP